MTRFETRAADWLPVEHALRRVLAGVHPLGPEEVSLDHALGRALANGVTASATLPPWDNSAMDGYAVRKADILGSTPTHPAELKVVGETRAGEDRGHPLQEGQALRIMTGAPVPPGADSVVRVEDTDAEKVPGRLRVFSDSDGLRNIRPEGQDMREGHEVLPRGTTVGAGQVGLLAATGASTVKVHGRPQVAILSNGDEIAGPHEFERVRNGKAIPETNAPSLAAAVSLAGGIPLRLGVAKDTVESILEKVETARSGTADVLLTSGGASMGEHDLFKRVLDRVGFQLDFWRVKMRPGTPFSFGWLPRKGDASPIAVFGLPGNPASSFVTFQIFARPFLLRMGGHTRIHRRIVRAQAGDTFRSAKDFTHFFRVALKGNSGLPVASLTGSQTSGLVSGQGLAQGLAVVPEGLTEISEGDTLQVLLLDDLGHDGDEPGYAPG